MILSYFPLGFLDDVSDFAEGSELFHVVTSALDSVPCFEELRHGLKNLIESEEYGLGYFRFCLD